MDIKRLEQNMIPAVIEIMELGAPFITARTYSDYWLYASLFSSSCLVAIENDMVVGAVIAFRSQDTPNDVYIQDVMVHPDHRGRGVARTLIDQVALQAAVWGCGRLYLTSEPDNSIAHISWTQMGFANVAGDHEVDGVFVIMNFKGPGKDRVVYERRVN